MIQALDAVVIGGGLAGLTAALRAAQAGSQVVVIERGPENSYLCNSRICGGVFHICFRDVEESAESLDAYIRSLTSGTARPDLCRLIAHQGRDAVRWLQLQGVKTIRGGPAVYHRFTLAPPRRNRIGQDWQNRGGDVMLAELEARFVEHGGRLIRGMRATRLLMQDDRCTGVAFRSEEGTVGALNARSVVVADGGFPANAEMVNRFLGPQGASNRFTRNAGTGQGDGLRMCEEAGAALVGTDAFYGHLLSHEVRALPQLWPYPFLDTLATAGIVVDQSGTRFADEGKGGIYLANAVARTDAQIFIIFDDEAWNSGPGRPVLVPPNPNLPLAGVQVPAAGNLLDLASACGIDRWGLSRSVEEHNSALANGSLARIQPPRTDPRGTARPIVKPPFYALRAVAGITYMMGGIAIDATTAVLRPDGSRIDGLFAAGAATGGVEGGPDAGYVGGLIKAATTGMAAGDAIASRLRQRKLL